MKPKHLFLCLCLFVALPLCGCTTPRFRSQKSLFSYRNVPFRTEVCGTLHGVAFSAVMTNRETGETGESFDGSIRYLTPNAAEGLWIRKRSDGSVLLQTNEISATVSEESLYGLLRPLTLLLTPTEYERIESAENEIRLYLADGACLTLSRDGIPLRVDASNVTFEIVWWEAEGS